MKIHSSSMQPIYTGSDCADEESPMAVTFQYGSLQRQRISMRFWPLRTFVMILVFWLDRVFWLEWHLEFTVLTVLLDPPTFQETTQ